MWSRKKKWKKGPGEDINQEAFKTNQVKKCWPLIGRGAGGNLSLGLPTDPLTGLTETHQSTWPQGCCFLFILVFCFCFRHFPQMGRAFII